jgi:hypothetical protein
MFTKRRRPPLEEFGQRDDHELMREPLQRVVIYSHYGQDLEEVILGEILMRMMWV